MMKLMQAIPSLDESIFKTLFDIYGEELDWLSQYEWLDLEYLGNQSGQKSVAPIIDMLIKMNNDTKLTITQMHKLANIIYGTYHEKWKRYYALLQAKYNPIENYSMIEEEKPDIVRTEKATNDYEVKDVKKTSTDLTTASSTATSGSGYGFNSTASVDLNDANGSQRTNVRGTANSNFEEDSHKQTGGLETTEKGTRKLTRSGNIGVTTSQQMMTQELEFWKWTFYNSVFKDIDAVLTLSIYEI